MNDSNVRNELDLSAAYTHAPSSAYVYESELSTADDEASGVFVSLLEDSTILRLDGAGSLIWEILGEPATAEEVVNEVASIFQESPETVRESVIAFMQSLLGQKLITVK